MRQTKSLRNGLKFQLKMKYDHKEKRRGELVNICLDSSVIVTALRKQEVHYEDAKNLLEQVKDGNHIAIEPYIVLIEVVAAIKRRTGSTKLAKRVKNDILAIDTINFTDLESTRANDASEIALNLGHCPNLEYLMENKKIPPNSIDDLSNSQSLPVYPFSATDP